MILSIQRKPYSNCKGSILLDVRQTSSLPRGLLASLACGCINDFKSMIHRFPEHHSHNNEIAAHRLQGPGFKTEGLGGMYLVRWFFLKDL